MIIDVHTHLGSVRSYSPVLKGVITVSKDDLKEYMNAVGVDYAVLLSTPELRPDIGENIYDNTVIVQVQDGKFVTVWPETVTWKGKTIKVAAAKPRVPMPTWKERGL